MASYDPNDIWADSAHDLSLYRLLPMSPIEMSFITNNEVLKMAFLTGDLPMGGEILTLTEERGLEHSNIV